ncbi:MAG: diguanylate cyclase, partial [Myxococcota bacterium]
MRAALLALLRRPSESLTSRIILLVFTATVLTALLVTWASIQSIHGFLSGQINRRFPELLSSTEKSLDLWYAQVRLDVDTFARSATMEANIATLQDPSSPEEARLAREEVEHYLSYILGQFEQYEALFVLDEKGRNLLWIGEKREIPDALRKQISARRDANAGNMLLLEEGRLQLASAPVKRGERQLGTLHAVLDLSALDGQLAGDDLGEESDIFLVGEDGRYLTAEWPRIVGGEYGFGLPGEGAPARVTNYTTRGGKRVVGAAVHFARFGWAIVVEEEYDAAFAPVFRLIGRVLLWNLGIVVLFALVALRIAISIVRPLKALSEGAERVAQGERGVEIADPGSHDELGLLTRTFNQMTDRLHRHQRELEKQNAKLELLSITDELTRVYNHRYFVEQLPVEIKRARREDNRLALVMLDIDDFKKLNDTFGHAAGDEVLRSVAEVMYTQIRDTDVLARYGGEEFVLLTAQKGLEGAIVLAEKVRSAVAALPVTVDTQRRSTEVRVTISAGVAVYKGDAKRLFNEADAALY